MSKRIDPRLGLTAEVQRVAAEEIGAALRHLEARDDPDAGLHECRKQLKNLRALLRLVRSGDREFVRKETDRYRAASAQLAGAREAAALIETLDRLASAFPDETPDGALAAYRGRLVARRAGMPDGNFSADIDAAASACRAGLGEIGKLALPERPEKAADMLADGVRKTLRRAANALRSAQAHGGQADFHDLRKAFKAHSEHLSVLRKFWPSPVKARRKAVDAFTEKLGELNDIFVLGALLRDEPPDSQAETRLLEELCDRSERKLRKTCLAAAPKLFRDSPKRSARKLARRARRRLAAVRAARHV